MTHDAACSRQCHSPKAIEAMIDESRGATINLYRDDWYWMFVRFTFEPARTS